MYVLIERNVCDLLPRGLGFMRDKPREKTRNGDALVAPAPVMSVYQRPTERVLRSPQRDANPFFHLIESLWMLAGRDDVATLNHYVGDFGGRYAEEDGRVHGAYGHRWRVGLGFDQLDVIVRRLLENPSDRQCVLQMWDARADTLHQDGFDDLLGDWKDRPCNTHVYFRVRTVPIDPIMYGDGVVLPRYEYVLDMTVCCRSNDVVLGAYGANAVHFSMLQEYVAGRVRTQVGTMYQLSNNYHVYVDQLAKMEKRLFDGKPTQNLANEMQPYGVGVGWEAEPIGEHWGAWDDDLHAFMECHDVLWSIPAPSLEMRAEVSNRWFAQVAWKVAFAYFCHKHDRRDEALAVAGQIEAGDWRGACVEWLLRRYAR
jgi:thymidylate synthase